jgi:hypothetical protein
MSGSRVPANSKGLSLIIQAIAMDIGDLHIARIPWDAGAVAGRKISPSDKSRRLSAYTRRPRKGRRIRHAPRIRVRMYVYESVRRGEG